MEKLGEWNSCLPEIELSLLESNLSPHETAHPEHPSGNSSPGTNTASAPMIDWLMDNRLVGVKILSKVYEDK